MWQRIFAAVAVWVLLAAGVAGILAQDPRGSIGGRIVDQPDAVVIGAKVQVTNMQTGVTASVRSNESGTFLVPFLLPGTYKLSAEMPSFKTYSQENVQLRVADALDLTLRLEVGNIADTVTVKADAQLLETGTSTPGTVIDERRLLELPQKGARF